MVTGVGSQRARRAWVRKIHGAKAAIRGDPSHICPPSAGSTFGKLQTGTSDPIQNGTHALNDTR